MSWTLRLILFVSLMLISEYYVLRTVFKSLKILFPASFIHKYRIIKVVLIFIINFIPIFLLFTWTFRLLGGPNINLPEKNSLFDALLYYPFWIAIVIFLQILVLILPLDLIRIVIFRLYKKNRAKLENIFAKIVFIISVITLIYVPIRIYIDKTQISSRQTIYELENLHPDLENIRIGVISDIQADWYNNQQRITNYINTLNKAKPDFVLIPGDMITQSSESIPVAAEAVGNIKSNYGIYACVGDHDNWAYGRNIMQSRTEVINKLAEHNALMLDNKNYILQIGSSKIGMTFITDTYSERIKDELLDSLTNKLKDVDLKILISHQPNGRTREMAIKKGYNLMISGHTHGGQITVLFPFYNLSPTLLETKYVKGDFWFNNLLMVVNGGLGMSLAPIRYNSTPEVITIILKNK